MRATKSIPFSGGELPYQPSEYEAVVFFVNRTSTILGRSSQDRFFPLGVVGQDSAFSINGRYFRFGYDTGLDEAYCSQHISYGTGWMAPYIQEGQWRYQNRGDFVLPAVTPMPLDLVHFFKSADRTVTKGYLLDRNGKLFRVSWSTDVGNSYADYTPMSGEWSRGIDGYAIRGGELYRMSGDAPTPIGSQSNWCFLAPRSHETYSLCSMIDGNGCLWAVDYDNGSYIPVQIGTISGWSMVTGTSSYLESRYYYGICNGALYSIVNDVPTLIDDSGYWFEVHGDNSSTTSHPSVGIRDGALYQLVGSSITLIDDTHTYLKAFAVRTSSEGGIIALREPASI